MSELSTRSVTQLIKGETDKRVSSDAGDELAEELEEYATDIAEEAIEVAKENGRKTVRMSDIREVIGYER